MGFISLLFAGIMLVMAAFGIFDLILALIFLLVSRHRRKKGVARRRGFKIAGIVFLCMGIIGLAPMLLAMVLSGIDTLQNKIQVIQKVRMMPERAESHVEYNEDGSYSDEFILYKDKEYILVNVVPVIPNFKLSEGKAYVDIGNYRGGILYEVNTDTGYDLLIVLSESSSLDDLELDDMFETLYCRRDQAEEFEQMCDDSATQYCLYDDDEMGEGIAPERLGICDEFLGKVASGKGDGKQEDWSSQSEYQFDLYQSEMEGLFLEYCASVSCYQGKWYCFNGYAYGYNGHTVNWWKWYPNQSENEDSTWYLPEAGQDYMNDYVKNADY